MLKDMPIKLGHGCVRQSQGNYKKCQVKSKSDSWVGLFWAERHPRFVQHHFEGYCLGVSSQNGACGSIERRCKWNLDSQIALLYFAEG